MYNKRYGFRYRKGLFMIATKQVDIRANIKKYFDIAFNGEPVIVSRKENRNVVIISETEYNELAKAKGLKSFRDRSTSCYGGISTNENYFCRRWMERIPLLANPG